MPPRSENDGAVRIMCASTAVSGSSDSSCGSTSISRRTTSAVSCSSTLPRSFTSDACKAGSSPACSMPAMERDKRRSAMVWLVSRPIATAARSGASGPSARTVSVSNVNAERNRSGPLRS